MIRVMAEVPDYLGGGGGGGGGRMGVGGGLEVRYNTGQKSHCPPANQLTTMLSSIHL